MSERHRQLTVLLDQDYPEDTAKEIAKVINMIKGVDSVGTSPAPRDDSRYMTDLRTRLDLQEALHLLMTPWLSKDGEERRARIVEILRANR